MRRTRHNGWVVAKRAVAVELLKIGSFKTGLQYDASSIPPVRVGDRVLAASAEDREGMLVLRFPEEIRLKRGETMTIGEN